jgi:4-carboxymuconolactone decarboxylase
LLETSELDPEQLAFYCQLQALAAESARIDNFMVETDDGRLIGPFNPVLYNPLMGRGLTQWIIAEHEHSTLEPRIRQVAILTVAYLWEADYVIYSHLPVARRLGLTQSALDVVSGKSRDAGVLTPHEAAAFDFTRQLVQDRTVDPATYRTAVDRFTAAGVVDLTQVVALYLTTAVLLSAFEVPAPEARGEHKPPR